MWLPIWVLDGNGFTMVHLVVRIGALRSATVLATASFASTYQIPVAAALPTQWVLGWNIAFVGLFPCVQCLHAAARHTSAVGLWRLSAAPAAETEARFVFLLGVGNGCHPWSGFRMRTFSVMMLTLSEPEKALGGSGLPPTEVAGWLGGGGDPIADTSLRSAANQ
jgi:hypothetical protein